MTMDTNRTHPPKKDRLRRRNHHHRCSRHNFGGEGGGFCGGGGGGVTMKKMRSASSMLLRLSLMTTMSMMMMMMTTTTGCSTSGRFLLQKNVLILPHSTTTIAEAPPRLTSFGLSSSSSSSSFPLLEIRGGSSPQPPPSGFGLSGRVAPRVVPTPSSSKTSPTGSSTKQGRQRQYNNPNKINDDGDADEEEKEEEDKRVGGVSAKEMMNSFLTRESRNAFVARVYGILSCQLTFTALVCILFGVYPPLTELSRKMRIVRMGGSGSQYHTNPLVALPLGGIILSTISWFTVCASPTARRQSPKKWWWLTLFTIGEAISVGCVSSLYDFKSVVLAMGATAVATITVSAYTIFQSNPKYDLSQWGATLSSWAMILLVYILVGILQNAGIIPFELVPFNDMIYSAFASVLFSVYLAHHTKLIVGGKHAKYRMNEKDYVFGAMALYVDIVNIFLNLLQLLGKERDD
mmetsp:Transcript_42223/g.101611  ORF Transcript_42223/g.101611 Transcript_42223/m.101611 type:complete len:461 (+) Transcript_42223:12-1394(+)